MVRLAALAAALAACGASPPEQATTCGSLRVLHPTQCGASLDLTPIHRYTGAVAGVEDREDAVALIAGTCTGTLIAAAAGPVVVTAGHCVGLGDRPLVAFNVEAEPDGDMLVTEGEVIERADEPDYALLRLDKLPAVTPTPLTTRATDLLASIQHPRGGPKVIAEGPLLDTCDGFLAYGVDTLVGSSGAGVLNDAGYLVAIHSDGDCTEDGRGDNRGSTAHRIVEVSAYLEAADLGDR